MVCDDVQYSTLLYVCSIREVGYTKCASRPVCICISSLTLLLTGETSEINTQYIYPCLNLLHMHGSFLLLNLFEAVLQMGFLNLHQHIIKPVDVIGRRI